MIIADFQQRTPEWLAARLGIPTSSNFDKILTPKGEPSKSAIKYLYKLAGEKVCGIAEETYQNGFMQRGTELEQEAREFYELTKDAVIEQVGLCYPDERKIYACSPDGLIGNDGLIEIKCPIASTHVGYLLDNSLPMDYFPQIQGQLLVTGRKWVDFLSYYPGLKPLLIRVHRDESYIGKLKSALETFCKELELVIKKIS